MHKAVEQPKPHTIPQDVVLAILNRCDETREFMADVWLNNPHLAKQGGRKVAELTGTLLLSETKED